MGPWRSPFTNPYHTRASTAFHVHTPEWRTPLESTIAQDGLDDVRWNAMTLKQLDGIDPFVIAVRTTGIYCRVGCPARTPHRHNVTFMDSVGQAQEAGFRACKRCHPDESDLSPWQPRRIKP